MKKNVSLREVVLLFILITIVSYYYFVQVPIQKETDAIASQQADTLSEIDIKMAMLTTQKNMQKELDAVYAQYGGNPPHMPDFDNADAVLTELNAILSTAEYDINFKDQKLEESSYVMRRSVMLTYITKDYATALRILHRLADSSYENQISDLSVTNDTLRNVTENSGVNVSLVMTFYEYVKGK